MKVLLAQLSPKVGDTEHNLHRMRETLAGRAADLAVFGELYLSGYMARDQFSRLAEPINGTSVEAVRKLAAESGTVIVFGMPELDPETKAIYDAAVLVTPKGKAFSYRKVYLANFGPFEEGLYFGRGRELRPFDIGGAKVGLLICYDIFFPELAKLLVLQGADVLVCISASPNTSRPLFEKVLPARAVENACFVVYSNLVGTELNMVFSGNSLVIGPRGEEKARASELAEETREVEIDLGDVPVARELRPTVRDTRFEILDLLRRMRPRGGK